MPDFRTPRRRIILSASRYDRTPQSLADDMARWRRTLSEGPRATPPTVAIVTEVGRPARQRALEHAGWHSYVPDIQAGEVAVAWDAAVHRCRASHRWGRAVTTLDFNNRPGVAATAAYLTDQDHPSMEGDLYVGIHFPAGVQDGNGWSDRDAAVRAHKDATDGTRVFIRDIREWLRQDRWVIRRVVLGYDANLDVGRDRWRQYLSRQFPGFQHVWGDNPPGDHGHRQITVAMVKGGQSRHPQELPTRSSDHDAMTFIID